MSGSRIRNPGKDAKDEYKIIANARRYVRKSLQAIIKEAKKKDDKQAKGIYLRKIDQSADFERKHHGKVQTC